MKNTSVEQPTSKTYAGIIRPMPIVLVAVALMIPLLAGAPAPAVLS